MWLWCSLTKGEWWEIPAPWNSTAAKPGSIPLKLLSTASSTSSKSSAHERSPWTQVFQYSVIKEVEHRFLKKSVLQPDWRTGSLLFLPFTFAFLPFFAFFFFVFNHRTAQQNLRQGPTDICGSAESQAQQVAKYAKWPAHSADDPKSHGSPPDPRDRFFCWTSPLAANACRKHSADTSAFLKIRNIFKMIQPQWTMVSWFVWFPEYLAAK